MIKYLSVGELLFEGARECSSGYSKEEFKRKYPTEDLYVVIKSDTYANYGRGLNAIYFRGRKIASELMNRPAWGIELSGPSVGLYRDAEKWLLKNLSQII